MRISFYFLLTLSLAGCIGVSPEDARSMSDSGLCQQAHDWSMLVGGPPRPGVKHSVAATNAEIERRGLDCARYVQSTDRGPTEVVVF